jgi:bacillithiol system protein YtxJ
MPKPSAAFGRFFCVIRATNRVYSRTRLSTASKMGLFNRIFSGEGGSKSPASTGSDSQRSPAWRMLRSRSDLDALLERSRQHPCLIFKHSTRCSISAMALSRLESGWNLPDKQPETWFLDLLAHRDLSAAIAAELGVQHQSPQVILVRDGAAVYTASHSAISPQALAAALET